MLTRGTSYENRANLSQTWYDEVIKPYEGTARGQQEIEGILLDSLPGALWNREMIVTRKPPVDDNGNPAMTKVVVGVDPSLGDGETSDECGIVALLGVGEDGITSTFWATTVGAASPMKLGTKQVLRRLLPSTTPTIMVVERNAGGRRALLKHEHRPGL